MQQYLDILRQVLDRGVWKQQRAVLKSTGQRPRCLSLFGAQARFDLTEGFPLVTTRKISFHVVKAELFWFLRGFDNITWLNERDVHIWDAWAWPDGGLGLCYPSLWRKYPARYEDVDQVENLLANITLVRQDPEAVCARRLVLTSWHPDLARQVTPAGCHTLAQFDITDNKLNCHLYMRSADVFLGLPHNIGCYSLLTELLARVTGLTAGDLIWSGGSVHVYENHLVQAKELLRLEPFSLPRLVLDDRITSVDGIDPDWVRLEGYRHHPPLKGEVSV